MTQVDVQKVSDTHDRALPIFAEFDRLADRIRLQAYNLFARRGDDGHALDDWLAAERELCWPAAELVEGEGEFVLKVALAGFEPKEIALTATPREIMIKGDHERRGESAAETDPKLRWSEFRSENVFRRVELPAAIDVEKVSANFENGLLKVVAPKAAAAAETTKTIPISGDA